MRENKQSINFVLAGYILMLIIVNVSRAHDGAGMDGAKADKADLLTAGHLKKFVDEIPDVPKLLGYRLVNGSNFPKHLKIGMFHKKWKFHRDLPATPVFAYGTSKRSASIPGPTIEALQGIRTHVTWENHLPWKHILPWDPTIPTAIPKNGVGVPTVVHLHGGIHRSDSDGHTYAWFTNGFREKGPAWSRRTYTYLNHQQPGNLFYHDHAMGLTRVNLLAGLVGSYVIRQPQIEDSLGLPPPPNYDRTLLVSDRDFFKNGSIYVNPKGNNPNIHPEWEPEYFGDVIIVNGKAWPKMTVRRRKYRFRIINVSNARFFRFGFNSTDDGLDFIHVGSDSAYLDRPVRSKKFLLAPSEIADVVIDFSKSKSASVILANDAPYPYPTGDKVNPSNSKVMKFIIQHPHPHPAHRHHEGEGEDEGENENEIPAQLLRYPSPDTSVASTNHTDRYITMYEYESPTDMPTHLYINGLSYDDPVTETPKAGTSEIWNVINLTDDNHPLHIHLALFKVLDQTHLTNLDHFKDCMNKHNDAPGACRLDSHARGRRVPVPPYEKGWKNVFKMRPGFLTRIYVTFSYIHTNNSSGSYAFNAAEGPGYAYHCHILDHEDNAMMRPLKLLN